MSTATATASKGDRRRAALLGSLGELLQESSLESISIAEISRRAGVTRSAFYFYFESKAVAVAALMEQLYDASTDAAAVLGGDGPPAERIAGMVAALLDAFEQHRHLFGAMLEARAESPAVRELWDADRESFLPVVAGLITAERDAGRAPSGPPAEVLARVLLELNDRMLERLALGGPLARAELEAGVVHVWLATIYGSVPEPTTDPTTSTTDPTEDR